MSQRPAPPLLKNREHTVMVLAGSSESVLLGFREAELLLVNSASAVCGRWVGRKGGLKAAFCQGAVSLHFPFRSVWSRKGRSNKIWGVGERLLDLHRVGS